MGLYAELDRKARIPLHRGCRQWSQYGPREYYPRRHQLSILRVAYLRLWRRQGTTAALLQHDQAGNIEDLASERVPPET